MTPDAMNWRAVRRQISVLSLVALAVLSLGADDSRNSQDLLRRSTDSSWYDSDNQRVTAGKESTRSINVEDRYRSVAKPANASQSYSFWTVMWTTIGSMGTWILSSWITLGVVILLVALIAVAWVARDAIFFGSSHSRVGRRTRSKNEKADIADLPFAVDEPIDGLLDAARRFREAGDYSRAIIYLFSHVLIELDSARCIRLERGKTNRSYLRELRNQPHFQSFCTELVFVFERAFFGKHVVTQELFELLWGQLAEFDNLISEAKLGTIQSSSSSRLSEPPPTPALSVPS